MNRTKGQIIHKIGGREMLYLFSFLLAILVGLAFFYHVAKLYVRTKTNSIKKENCDYRFIEVDNVKTRSLNLESRK